MKSMRAILSTLILVFTYGIGATVFGTYISPYLSSLGFANSTISYLYAVAPVVIIFFMPFFGKLSDILGRKKMILFGVILEILSLIALIFVPINLFTAAGLIAFGVLGIIVIELTLLSQLEDKIKDKSRGTFTGIFESIRTLGIVLGPLVGAFIVSISDIKLTFKIGLLVFILLLFITLFTKSDYLKHKRPRLKDFSFIKEVKSFMSHRQLRGMAILGIAANFGKSGSMVFLPLLIIQDLKSPLFYVGVVASMGMLINLFQFVHGWLCDKKGCEKFIIFGTTIAAFAYFFMSQVSSIYSLVAIVVLFSLGSSMWNTSAVCFMSRIAEKEGREGEIMGTYGAISSVGIFLTFIISGIVASMFGTRTVFLMYGIIILLAVLFSLGFILKKKETRPVLFESA